MDIASIWQLKDGSLELKPELERAPDAALTERVLAFLGGGGIVMRASGLREDRLDPSRLPRVPLGYRSDGEWIWPLELAYYLEQHGILPQGDFVAHMRDRGFVARAPSSDELAAAARLLSG